MNRILLWVACLAVTSFAGIVQADDLEQYQEIRNLAQAGKLAEAEEAFQAASKEYPDSARIRSLHSLLYSYNNRAENYAVAKDHLDAYLKLNVLPSEENPSGNLASLPGVVNVMITVYKNAGQEKQVGERLGEIVALIEPIAEKDKDNANAQIAVRDMRNRELLFQAEMGQQDEARTILTTRLKAAEQAVEEKPDDTSALLDLVFLLKGDSQLADELGSDDADAKRQKFLDRLVAAAQAHSENVPLVVIALGEQLSAVGNIARRKPLEAEKQFKTLKEFADSIESEDAALKSRLASISRSFPAIERAIESGKFHLSLIGKEAFPLEAEAWVNGEPLTDEDLKGKVVLLDFWAVWCGPCIATFPHLREWREEYEDKGLVIIGVTRYYNYEWDAEANRSKKAAEEITPEEEQAAMLKFAEHYELKHRFMITPKEDTIRKNYGVSGIPQAVLIDREGKIRLIRVGSGDANAEEIGALLSELIGDGE